MEVFQLGCPSLHNIQFLHLALRCPMQVSSFFSFDFCNLIVGYNVPKPVIKPLTGHMHQVSIHFSEKQLCYMHDFLVYLIDIEILQFPQKVLLNKHFLYLSPIIRKLCSVIEHYIDHATHVNNHFFRRCDQLNFHAITYRYYIKRLPSG